jgi:hypothetical protein
MSDKEKRTARSIQFRGVIDRIEDNDMAVVLLGDDEREQIDLPVAFLPADASNGDHLDITINLDDESRGSMRDRIKNLQAELLNRGKK